MVSLRLSFLSPWTGKKGKVGQQYLPREVARDVASRPTDTQNSYRFQKNLGNKVPEFFNDESERIVLRMRSEWWKCFPEHRSFGSFTPLDVMILCEK